MKKEETKQFILWCVLGAIGCGFMAAGDWLLDEGKLSDFGTHEELMARSQIYRDVYDSQMKQEVSADAES